MPLPNFREPYQRLKRLARQDIRGPEVGRLLADLALEGHRFIRAGCEAVDLVSRVADKTYVAFRDGHNGTPSRPVRADMFPTTASGFDEAVAVFHGNLVAVSPSQASAAIYGVAMAFCAANDVAKKDDRKTPATYFEILVGHLVARVLDLQPRTSIPVLDMDAEQAELPTDYWFDLGPHQQKIHLPVKMSTRERAVQVWAHQRILDGVYGTGRLTGILIALAETKLDRRTLEVVEICVPEQWRLYQRYIAPIKRVYYLDPPGPYVALAPDVEVRSIGQMFRELPGSAMRP